MMLLMDFTKALELISHPNYPEAYCARVYRALSWCTEIAGLLQITEVDGQPVRRDLLYADQPHPGALDNTMVWNQSVRMGPFRRISPPYDVTDVGSPGMPYTFPDQAVGQRPPTPAFDNWALASQNEFWSWSNYPTGDSPSTGSVLLSNTSMPVMDEMYQTTLDPFNPLQPPLGMIQPNPQTQQYFT
jgi:hypothetical protein